MNQELFLSQQTDSTIAIPKKSRKPRKPHDPNVPKKLNVAQQIIIKHVAGMEGNRDVSAWGREGKICATLRQKYGSDFLLWVSPPEDYQVNSLTFYYSVLGRNHLSDQLVEFSKFKENPPKQINEIDLSGTKIEEDIHIEKKPKTLKEFLDYYGKK